MFNIAKRKREKHVQRCYEAKDLWTDLEVAEGARRGHADLRLDRARRLLKHSSMDVTEVALACGFTSPAHFSRAYRLRFDRSG
ncbi:helix-turn-helix domain-containing protein [Microbaculum marinisediminis]|uniref:helix-turn-helix domain-containing protein n=1 Tax=Microbaculum marinisediminis TaxID=2931392 RepID=UPI0028F71364|nr:helix-turn-helix domain-containing protein [Microbaculum sp. A6E488]